MQIAKRHILLVKIYTNKKYNQYLKYTKCVDYT